MPPGYWSVDYNTALTREVPTTLTQFMQMDRRIVHVRTALPIEMEWNIEQGPINSDSLQLIDGTT